MKQFGIAGILIWAGASAVVLGSAGVASAQTCSTTQYPYPLANGSVADANQVTADLNCAPVYGLANWSGNVGIGTPNPLTKLQVNGTTWVNSASGDVAARAQGLTVSYSPQGTYVNGTDPQDGLRNTSFISAGAGTANSPVIITLRNTLSSPFWDIVMDPHDSSSLKFSRAGYTPTLTLSAGNVGIGTTSPAAPLHVNGNAIITGGVSQSSDARLKRDVRPLTGALALVAKMQGVRYNWKPMAERTVGKDLNLPLDEPQIGFLAQDLEKVLPEAVKAPKPGISDTYSVEETKVVPVLVEAIKEQQAEIKELREEIAKLRATKQ